MLTGRSLFQESVFAPGYGAVVSPDSRYRYYLYRQWRSEGERVVFCMCNPSKADAAIDDPTIRKCVGFAKRWGYSGIGVVNVLAWRATDPNDLAIAAYHNDVVGPENHDYIDQYTRAANVIVCAWGNALPFRFQPQARRAVEILNRYPGRLRCLGRTGLGNPRHPLMLSYETALVPFEVGNG